jgi:hypothetical protein
MTATLQATLQSIARLEAAGIPPRQRLTDPDRALWNTFKRKLGPKDFIALLHEDGAQSFPVPFALDQWRSSPLEALDDAEADRLINTTSAPLGGDSNHFLRYAAALLGLPSGGRLADLPRVQPHERVLELPGTSGRAAAYLAARHPDLAYDAFTFVALTDADRVLIGLGAVELRANEPTVLSEAELRRALAGGTPFDRVIAHREHPAGADLARELFSEQEGVLLWV